MTAEQEIKKLLKTVEKGLKPTDKIRWKWGYAAGLREALKIIQKHGGEQHDRRDQE